MTKIVVLAYVLLIHKPHHGYINVVGPYDTYETCMSVAKEFKPLVDTTWADWVFKCVWIDR